MPDTHRTAHLHLTEPAPARGFAGRSVRPPLGRRYDGRCGLVAIGLLTATMAAACSDDASTEPADTGVAEDVADGDGSEGAPTDAATDADAIDVAPDAASDASPDVADGSGIGNGCEDWTVAFDATDYGAFMSVWGRGSSDVWTVGGQPDLGDATPHGVAFHFDGDDWNEVPLPDGGMLNWVHGTDTSTWMGGEAGRVLRLEGTEVVDTFTLPTDAAIWGMWASADDDVWAVGGNPRDRESVPVMFHFDGDDWAAVTLPPVGETGARALFKIWGADADTLYAVGARGILYARNGDTWDAVETGIGADLISLWGRSADEIVVTGGRAEGVVGRYDGERWAFETLDRVSGLNGAWMDPEGAVLIDGASGRLLRFAPGENAFEDLETPTGELLHGVWGTGDGTCFAVGGSLMAPPPYTGVVLVGR